MLASWHSRGAGGAGGAGDAWNITTAVYVRTLDTSSQDTGTFGVTFKPDGTKMYMTGFISDAVNEYNLSTAWDISTAVYAHRYVIADSVARNTVFKPDGLTMFCVGTENDKVIQYDMSTAWDVSTSSFVRDFSLFSEERAPTGIAFKPDGTKMYMTGFDVDRVHEYDLSTAWDISTLTALQFTSVAAQDDVPRTPFFKPDGLKLFLTGSANNKVFEYDLTTAWDISTMTFLRDVSVSAQDTDSCGLTFKPDGLKMYTAGFANDSIYEYDLG